MACGWNLLYLPVLGIMAHFIDIRMGGDFFSFLYLIFSATDLPILIQFLWLQRKRKDFVAFPYLLLA